MVAPDNEGDRDVARTAGPFFYFDHDHPGVTGASIRSTADSPGKHAATLSALSSQLEGDAKKVAGQVEGDIQAGLTCRPAQTSAQAESLAQHGVYAVGLLIRFSKYVDTFDDSVDKLNQTWHTRVNNIVYGMQHDPDVRSGKVTIDRPAIQQSVEHDLRPQYKKAVQKLDTDADEIVTGFKQGPTDANIKAMILEGILPITVTQLFPGVKITPAEVADHTPALVEALKTLADYWLPDPSKLVAWDPGDPMLKNILTIMSSDEFAAFPMGLAGELIRRLRITPAIVATNPEASATLKKIVPILTAEDPYLKLPSGLLVPRGGTADPTVGELIKLSEGKGFSTPGKPFLTGDPEALPSALPKWAETGGKVLGVAGVALTLYGEGASTWENDNKMHPDWSTTHKVLDTAQRTVVVGGSAAAGGWAGAVGGAELGATIGSFGGPVGTVVGGVVGGVIGGFVGSKAGHEAGELLEDAGGAIADGASHVWHSVFG